MTFGENLKRLRLEKGLSQQELSEIAEVKPSSITRYEKGLSMPNSRSLCLLADALEVTMDELYGEGKNDF